MADHEGDEVVRILRALDDAGYDDVLVLDQESAETVLSERRRELIDTINEKENMSVSALASHLERKNSAISRDLGVLYEYNIINFRKDGKEKIPIIKHSTIITRPIVLNSGLKSTSGSKDRGEFPDYLNVDYSDGEGQTPDSYPSLEAKFEKALEVVEIGLREYENPAVMWTGGKDSTLTLYFVKVVAEQFGLDMPPAVFIDHYQHSDELMEFIQHWADEWDLEVIYARNEDLGDYVEEHGLEPGDDISVDALSEHNQHHIRNILEYEEDTFPFLLATYVGNHLLKTVALNDTLESEDIDGIISGIRWDEQVARADETFFSPRHDPDIYPPHDRIQPILQFKEADVWDAFWYFVVPETVAGYPDDGYVPQGYDDLPEGVTHEDIPVSPKYFEGFRSLSSQMSTRMSGRKPAWLQDFEDNNGRSGHTQDREDFMARLRDLGYM